MEIMTKEEYVISKMQKLIRAYIELDEGVHRLIGDDKYSKDNTLIDICSALDIAEDSDEASALIDHLNLDDAYDAYIENSEKDHIYDVAFSFTVSGTAQVHAKDEDEAEDYVNENLYIEPEVSFYEDDRQVGKIEVDDYNTEQSFDIDDTGDEYEN